MRRNAVGLAVLAAYRDRLAGRPETVSICPLGHPLFLTTGGSLHAYCVLTTAYSDDIIPHNAHHHSHHPMVNHQILKK